MPHFLRAIRLSCLAGAALLLLVGTACDGSGGGTDPPQGTWADRQGWRLAEVARIGAADGDGPDVFSTVVDVTLDLMARVWIADRQEIRIFDEQGRHIRTVGRKGAGPAEFKAIAGMQWDTRNRLWVLDSGNARFAIYDTAGILLETRPREALLMTTPWPGRFDRQGRLYDVDGGLRADGSIQTNIVRMSADGKTRDRFEIPFFKEEVFQITRGDARNRAVTSINVPFTGMQFWAVDPEGYVWIANTAHYRLERHAFGGGVRNVVQHNTAPVAVTRQERERRLDDYREFIRQGGKIDLSRIPDSYPALHGFLFDDEGHLWVSPITDADEGRALDVFRLDGSYLGRVALPTATRSSPKVIRNNRMLVVARDSLDLPTVHVLQIQKSGS